MRISGPPVVKDLEYWRIGYDRLVQIKQCYESHGYKIAKPPARDTWAKACSAEKA